MNPNQIIKPKRGVVATAAPHTAPPNWLTMNPNQAGTWTGWSLFHTSKENLFKNEKDGGDSSTDGSWWTPDLIAERDDITVTVSWGNLEVSLETLEAAFPSGNITGLGGYAGSFDGTSEEKAVFLLGVGGDGRRLGLYYPRVDLAVGDLWEVDPEKFFEVSLSGPILAATAKVSTPGATGKDEIQVGQSFAIYPPVALAAA